ncbi:MULTISPECIES: DUF4381 domain-containing protein [unclassified Vibrio]|uniref:DUF4381 domain-containing protein n=1 Tax=Vibrio sp. HB236076 TaxID=3232307 RepID=A0AB39HKZ6_9VIBR|nr:DUF4381 domain-containing protein [Vibrio sp. HB161653]MDP5252641.1 DUF4381 domain-containing protein [Vibrio sp. HB161653]
MTTNTHPLPLEPSLLPPTPSWLPLSWGWWFIIAFILLSLAGLVVFIRWRHRRYRAKKAALALLYRPTAPLTPSSALEILRQAALSYFDRQTIAKLSGTQWYQFLDQQMKTPCFVERQSAWQKALYQDVHQDNQTLIDDCCLWVEQALPPKRGHHE